MAESNVVLLHIETATKVCSVALSINGSLKQLAEIHDDGYAHGEQLTILIQQTLEKERMEIAQLNGVSVSAGPGSYTGLRIGVSTAKGLCYSLKIPLISIDTLQSMAVLAFQKYPSATVCPMIDARRMEVYSSIYNNQQQVVKPISADVLDELSYSEFEPLIAFGDGAPKCQEIWQNRAIQFDLELLPSAAGQTNLAFEKFLKSDFEDVAYFEPFYLKAFFVPTKKSVAE